MEICFPFTDFPSLSPFPCLSRFFKHPGSSCFKKKMAADDGQFSRSFLQTCTSFQGYYECSTCHVLAPDKENLLQHECVEILACSKLFLPVRVSRVKCCMNSSEKFFCNSSFTGEVSTTVDLSKEKETYTSSSRNISSIR